MKAVEDSGMVICLVDMRFVPAEADSAVELLSSVVERITAKPGCEGCSVSQEVVEPCRIRYCEIWISEAVFRTHVQSRDFRNLLVAMDMCSEKPQVLVGRLSGRTGIEYLKEMRGGLESILDPKS